jgi:hypothetical protein
MVAATRSPGRSPIRHGITGYDRSTRTMIGPKGTHHGAIIANGNLYCPATPRSLLEPGPLARNATGEQAAAHDAETAETARYKLGRLTRDDADGYHRVACAAATGKIRCPLRPPSMMRYRDRPQILQPPGIPRPAAPGKPSPCRPRSRGAARARHGQKHPQNVRPGCEDHQGPNVKAANVKTSWWGARGSNPEPMG